MTAEIAEMLSRSLGLERREGIPGLPGITWESELTSPGSQLKPAGRKGPDEAPV